MLVWIFFALTFALLFMWHRKSFRYWERHGIPYATPSTLVGNMSPLLRMRQTFSEVLCSLYRQADAKEPLVGIYRAWQPSLLLRDVNLIKRIFIKDFASFPNRTLTVDPHSDPLGSQNLFFIKNPEWRELRTQLSPVFTSGKTKQLYPLMLEIGQDLENLMEERLQSGAKVMDVKELSSRFTTDMIASIAFGIQAHSLTNPRSEYYQHSRSIFDLSLLRGLNFAAVLLLPPMLTSFLKVRIFPSTTSTYLRNTFEHVMAERERSGLRRNDLIDILLGMKLKGVGIGKPSDYLLAQAALFQTAGFETSSATMAFALYELAKHPQMQQRLRTELSEALRAGNGSISYEKLLELEYLRQVVDETLRLYPVLAFLERECLTPYSLAPYANYEVPKGMAVYVATRALHMDTQYWHEPEKFNPDRFAADQQQSINWDAYMPFGSGPHNCLGMRLGLLQTKLGLLHMLRRYRVVACERTVKSIQFDARNIPLTAKGGIHLRVERLPATETVW